jgi:hypothetical protein
MVLPTQQILDKAACIRPAKKIYGYPVGFQAVQFDLGFRDALLQTQAHDVFVLFCRDALGVGIALPVIVVPVRSTVMTGVLVPAPL